MTTAKEINEEQVLAAQKKWAEGIVEIGQAFTEKKDYTEVARQMIDRLYAYNLAPVLFKPTKAAESQFRLDKDSALSYFVATNGVCAEDKGFALTPWTNVRFDNAQILPQGRTALAMGNYYFTDTQGGETKVEYTFGYVLDEAGELRIQLHHSSIPFSN